MFASSVVVRHVRFGSKADMCSAQADVRFVPIADIGQCLCDAPLTLECARAARMFKQQEPDQRSSGGE